MSKYIITGGEGFIGSKIVREIEGFSYDLKSGHDILDKTDLTNFVNEADGIFHCAAKISVPESLTMPEAYHRTNVEGTKCLIDVAQKTKIVFSSSAAVYGESDKPVVETDTLNPKSPYAENKKEAEELLEKINLPHIVLRYFNVYGPGQSPQYAGVITAFINKALKGEDLVIYGDGEQVRDFVFVGDVVRANIMAMDYKNEKFGIFNIASGEKTTIKLLAETIIKLTKSSSKICYEPARKGDIFYSQADITKAKSLLSWSPKVSLEEGLEETIKYYKGKI
jgi:UDP-glucose 4-epimerase